MNRDPKQTQTLEEPVPHSDAPNEQDIALRTTLVQPIPLSRHPDFVRTRYWEKLSEQSELEPKLTQRTPYASASKTCVGLGPDDPIVRAVQAAKLQLMEAERKQREQANSERASHERPRGAEIAAASSASSAKTVLLPALEVLQLMASRVKPATQRSQPSAADEPVQLPKRKLKPLWLGCAALGLFVCAAGLASLMPAPAERHAEPSIVKPRPEAAPETKGVVAEPAAAAASVNAPAPSPAHAQLTEKAAVDALFAGDYALASRHYAALASAHPEQPVFGEAARILQRNVRAEPK